MSPWKINSFQFAWPPPSLFSLSLSLSFSSDSFRFSVALADGRYHGSRAGLDARPGSSLTNESVSAIVDVNTRVCTRALLVGSVYSFLFRGVLFTSILHGSRYNFYWLPHVDNIRFEHSDEMNCNICRLNWRAYFRADGSIDWKANNEHFRGGGGREGTRTGAERRRMIDWYSFLILEFSAVIKRFETRHVVSSRS